MQFRGSPTQWLHVSELKKKQCYLSLEVYTALTAWLPSSALPHRQQSRPTPVHSSSVTIPSQPSGLVTVWLPPCIAGQVVTTGEQNCLVLESLAHDNIPEVNISCFFRPAIDCTSMSVSGCFPFPDYSRYLFSCGMLGVFATSGPTLSVFSGIHYRTLVLRR
jgi:hypothetical protein